MNIASAKNKVVSGLLIRNILIKSLARVDEDVQRVYTCGLVRLTCRPVEYMQIIWIPVYGTIDILNSYKSCIIE